MTDSERPIPRGPRAAGKRERLVDGARRVFHEQGVERSTLADVAAVADVPAGNVYYYFKTKDDLVDAVIDAHIRDVKDAMQALERLRTPQARLKALARMLGSQGEVTSQFGCPQGTLCSELDKQDTRISRRAAELLSVSIDWAEQQFREMGRRDARDLAIALIAAYQGASLLTNTFRDPSLLEREARRLERWIDSLDQTAVRDDVRRRGGAA